MPQSKLFDLRIFASQKVLKKKPVSIETGFFLKLLVIIHHHVHHGTSADIS